ncbi:DUF4345 domain-containing protein [Dongia sp. agr-C8]
MSKRLLQSAVAVCCLVPIAAGGAGLALGPALVGDAGEGRDLDSHFRYLCGLLLGIGLGYAASVPGIERKRLQFTLLSTLVVIGGVGRLLSLFAKGAPSPVMLAALAMELIVTPLLTLWQWRVARRAGGRFLS